METRADTPAAVGPVFPSTTVGPAHRNSRLGPKSSCLQRVSYTCGGCVPAPLQVVSTGIGTESLEGVAEQWSTRVNRAAARRTRVLSEALRPSTSPTTQIRQRHAVVLCAVMNRRMFLANFVMLVLAGCGARAPVRSTPDRYVRRGLASWYGDAFDGKLTASGEPFDSNQFTTAHYDLPFDSRVRVRNLNNDREVELRVNDRVPPRRPEQRSHPRRLLRRRETAGDGGGRGRPHRDHRRGVGSLPVTGPETAGLCSQTVALRRPGPRARSPRSSSTGRTGPR